MNASVDNMLSPIPHMHKDLELIYIKKGNAICYADNKQLKLGEGDIFLTFPNQVHYYHNAEPGQYYVCIFSPDVLFGMGDVLDDYVPKINTISTRNKQVEKIFSDMMKDSESEYNLTYRVGLINQLMALVMADLELEERNKTKNTTLHKILRYCEDNFTSDITLDTAAETLHFSKYHISHLFNEKIGISFSTYINNLRIYKACELLKMSDNKTSFISEEVGFGSIRSFNRAFLQFMKQTPVQYRKEQEISEKISDEE